MKVLVTGGAGFIGSHVVDLYVDHGYKVVVVDDLSTGRILNLNPAAKLYEIDIRSAKLAEIFEHERPDFVNHHAAQIDVRRSVEDPLFDAEVNILGSLNLIEFAREFQVQRFVYVSTGGAVYGEPEYLPCDERHSIKPICQYGASKHTVEHYLYMYHVNYGLDYTVLRYPNVYGPRQDPHGEAGVIAIFIGQMLNGGSAMINGDGEQTRDFVFVKNIVNANLLACKADSGFGQAINLGSGKETSVNRILMLINKYLNKQIKPVFDSERKGELRRSCSDNSKSEKILGYKEKHGFEEGLKATINWVKQRNK